MNKLDKSQSQVSQLPRSNPAIVFIDCKPHWEIAKTFKVTLSTGEKVVISKGFQTDLASIPRILWGVFPPFGKYNEASIVHDFMYRRKYKRSFADKQFLFLMKQNNVSFLNRYLFYVGVRCFGWLAY